MSKMIITQTQNKWENVILRWIGRSHQGCTGKNYTTSVRLCSEAVTSQLSPGHFCCLLLQTTDHCGLYGEDSTQLGVLLSRGYDPGRRKIQYNIQIKTKAKSPIEQEQFWWKARMLISHIHWQDEKAASHPPSEQLTCRPGRHSAVQQSTYRLQISRGSSLNSSWQVQFCHNFWSIYKD